MIWILVIASVSASLYAVLQVFGMRRKIRKLEREAEYRKGQQQETHEHLDTQLKVMARFVSLASAGRSLTEAQILDGRIYSNIEREAAWQLVSGGDTLVLDVREPHEYATGHIPGALSVPVSKIEDAWRNVPRDGGQIVVHCAAGTRSAAACRFLSQEKGFTNLFNLTSGLNEWPGPLEKGNPE